MLATLQTAAFAWHNAARVALDQDLYLAVRQIAVSQFGFDASFALMKSEISAGTLVHGGFTPLNEMV